MIVVFVAGIAILASRPLKHGIDVSSPDYEAKLRSNLAAHKKDFERLIKMIQADRIEKVHVPKEGAWIFYTPLSEDRIREYRSIMQSLRIERGMHRLNSDTVILVAEEGGFAGHGWEVGYAWSSKTLQLKTGPYVFKPANDNWYLYNFNQG
ncbi:MAG: hypothetical protein HY079_02095 [Elusimicrobia bacterium]|nr:hypothetical protein [Elusimicrobiota bacterium]